MEIKSNSAILMGNGINNYISSQYSWKKLIMSLTDSKDIKEAIESSEKEISYPEYYDLICLEKKDEENRYKNLKNKIIAYIKDWQCKDVHLSFINFCIEKDIPVLTTNYDTAFLSGELLKNI